MNPNPALSLAPSAPDSRARGATPAAPRARAGRRRTLLAVLALGALAVLLASGCAKHIGDGCANNTECSINGDRQCDLAQLGGYCTIPECAPNTCPDQAMCVEFDYNVSRLARRYCVVGCTQTSECRQGYECQTPTAPGACPAEDPASGAPPASCTRVIDAMPARPGFCVQAEPAGG